MWWKSYVSTLFLKTELEASKSIQKEEQSITSLILNQQRQLVNVPATLPIHKRQFKKPMICFPLNHMHWYPNFPLIMPCWKQINTTSVSFTTHWLFIILITILHQVRKTKITKKKVHRLAVGGYKDINRSEELFDIYEMQLKKQLGGC